MNPPPTLIAAAADFESLAATAGGEAHLAIDTEFMREKTYRAELCLLQLGGDAWRTCVDPLAVDLAREGGWFRDRWQSGDCELILHAARQDLEVLSPLLGTPRRVFDTQIAAALAGLPPQVGYAELARRLLGVELSKAETRTDWSRRPLTPAQIDYALDDVRYLPALRGELLSRLQSLGRESWLREELAQFEDPSLTEIQPDEAWQRVKGLQGIDEPRQQLLQQLAAWRERRAIARNRPRGWILDDAVLRALVQEPPRTLDELKAVPDLPRGVADHVGDELLALIEACRLPASLPPLPKRSRPDPGFEATVRRLGDVAKSAAASLQLAPELLATRKDLEQVVRGNSQASPLHGWRRSVIGEKLLAGLG
jgi:ribonuclease D